MSEVFREYGLFNEEIKPILDKFEKNHKSWVHFMMKYELGLDEPDTRGGLKSASTIASSYILGGLIPLSPYFFVVDARNGLSISCL